MDNFPGMNTRIDISILCDMTIKMLMSSELKLSDPSYFVLEQVLLCRRGGLILPRRTGKSAFLNKLFSHGHGIIVTNDRYTRNCLNLATLSRRAFVMSDLRGLTSGMVIDESNIEFLLLDEFGLCSSDSDSQIISRLIGDLVHGRKISPNFFVFCLSSQ